MELSLGCPQSTVLPWWALETGQCYQLHRPVGESPSALTGSQLLLLWGTAESRADGIMANIDQWLTFGRRFPFTVAVAVKQDRRLAWSSLKWRKSNWSWRQDSNQPQGKFSLYQDDVIFKESDSVVLSSIRSGSVWSCLSFFPNNERHGLKLMSPLDFKLSSWHKEYLSTILVTIAIAFRIALRTWVTLFSFKSLVTSQV